MSAFAPPMWAWGRSCRDDAAPGRVELIEPAGDHRIVRVDTDGTPVTAKIAADEARFTVGDTVSVQLDWSRAHYFDRAGQRQAVAAAEGRG